MSKIIMLFVSQCVSPPSRSLCLSVYLCACFFLDPRGMGVGFPATHLRPWNGYFANCCCCACLLGTHTHNHTHTDTHTHTHTLTDRHTHLFLPLFWPVSSDMFYLFDPLVKWGLEQKVKQHRSHTFCNIVLNTNTTTTWTCSICSNLMKINC